MKEDQLLIPRNHRIRSNGLENEASQGPHSPNNIEELT